MLGSFQSFNLIFSFFPFDGPIKMIYSKKEKLEMHTQSN
jgi:hypothetical protein